MSYSNHKTTISPKLIAIGLLLFCGILFFFDLQPGKPEVTYTAAIAFLMAFLWISEALPLGVTSLLPIVLFPLLGVMDGKTISDAYVNYVIFLFIGGFIMALAMEKWNLHKRIALKVLSIAGGSPFMILFGFMASSSFLSMWISNTATAMMMLPMVISVTATLEEVHGAKKMNSFAVGLLLCIAYACTIGGTSTLVGTPPNLSFIRIYEIIFPNAPEISFGQWLIFALPIGILIFTVTLLQLYFLFKPKENLQILEKSFFREKYKALGKTTLEEKRVFILFLLLAILWVFRTDLNIGFIKIPGWSSLFKNPQFINDGTVAIFVSILLFIVPSTKKNKALVNWKIIRKIPWYIVFLLGGGFALAQGFVDSGLSTYIGTSLNSAGELSPLALVASLSGIMTFLTEFTSNTATTEMLLPIIAGLAVEIKVHPLLIMVPITIAASMAFMLPIATAPNAIAFGTGRIKMKDMIKAGFLINMISIAIIAILTLTWGVIVFDIDPAVFPDWANQVANINKESV
jgi:sodium-dependent dicarboxylate transporter 2/3/5